MKNDPKNESQLDNDYLHLVQNTEECVAADGDQDDPDLSGVDDQDDYSSAHLDGFAINQNVVKHDYGINKS
jgi:hypothetical protein